MTKRGRRPTRAQKMLLKRHNLDPANWLVMQDCPTCFKVLNRLSGNMRTLRRAGADDR